MNIINTIQNFFTKEMLNARASDPITSHQAAAQAPDVAANHIPRILEALDEYGPMGASMIAYVANLDKNQISRRLKEMQKMGLIELTGNIVKSNSNRNEREWKIANDMDRVQVINLGFGNA